MFVSQIFNIYASSKILSEKNDVLHGRLSVPCHTLALVNVHRNTSQFILSAYNVDNHVYCHFHSVLSLSNLPPH